jgi:hypothetical protein
MKPSKYNWFMFFKLPSAWWCGVRLHHLENDKAVVRIKHSWFNKNPFKSMFWAAQGMAAEFSTGVLVMEKIRLSKKPISMLVANNKANFSKKARGTITFSCSDGQLIDQAIEKMIASGEGQKFWMTSKGIDLNGDLVSNFEFEWTIKSRK